VCLRVLMFGWEFPPFQAGGLGTATHGLVKGLVRQGVRVTLVVPFPVEQADVADLRLVSAAEPMQSVKVHRIATPMTPYDAFVTFMNVLQDLEQRVAPVECT